MNHFRIAHQLERYKLYRSLGVKLSDRIVVPIDRRDHEMIDVTYLAEAFTDVLGLRQVQSNMSAADFVGASSRPVLLSASDHHILTES